MNPRRMIRAVVLSVLPFAVPGYALGQGVRGVGIVTTLSGEATVSRGMRAKPIGLQRHDDVFLRDQITTRERSLVRVLLGNKALLTVRELSVLTITEGAGRATVDLQSGKLGLAVVRRLMNPGEVIEVHTPNVVVGVRGTVLVVEIVPDASGRTPSDPAAVVTNVHLLHGKLDVWLRHAPAVAPIRLESRQTVQISGTSLGAVRPMPEELIAAATAGLSGGELSRAGLPPEFLSTLAAQQQIQMLANTTTGALGHGTLPAAGGVLQSGAAGRAVLPASLPFGLIKGN